MRESGDIYLVQELLGHRNVSTTQKYIGVNYATAREAVEAMALRSERDRTILLSRSAETETAKTLTDETLLLELARRGYDLRRPAGEVVKIAME